jgi:serine/threonine protein kinase
LEGLRHSAATSVNDALNAKVNWICDMFGSDSDGTPYLTRLLHRRNPEARPGEPVILFLKQQQLCPCRLQVMVGADFVKEPQGLDRLAEEIERTCPRPRRWRPEGRIRIDLKVEGELGDFVKNGGLEKLLKFLEENGVNDPEINNMGSGCVKLTLTLPEDQAERLCWLADSGALDQFGLLDFDYVPIEPEVPAAIPEGYRTYLLERARFLLGDSRPPLPLHAAEVLASETLRSAYRTAETAFSGNVTRAKQLALLEKIQDRLLIESFNVTPGDVSWVPQETDPYQALTGTPSSPESSKSEPLQGEGTSADSGVQSQAQHATNPPTEPFVPADDKAPPVLLGYKILEQSGWPKEGGMGVVWLARELQFQRLVAVKVMKAGDSADRHRVRLFLDEARITAQLAHPSMVPVHAMGQHPDGRPYYAMKLVEGKTLAEILQGASDIASRRTELLQVFARVCEALAFAHRKGVLHLDLKPSNIMVGAHNEVQVMDWGIAKLLDESEGQPGICEPLAFAYRKGVFHRDQKPRNVLVSAAGEELGTDWGLAKLLDKRGDQRRVAGTWPYMPPEQATGRMEEVDRRSDVFGLGAILCAILTSKPPYADPTPEVVMRQAGEADLVDAYMRLEKCGADKELIDLARACLSADPKDRPPDASVVEKRLTDYLASVEKRLRRAERDRAAALARAKEARRRMLWVAASAGLFLLLLLLAAFFAWRESKARQEHLTDTLDRTLSAAMSGDLDTAEQAVAEAEAAGASAGQVHMLRGQIALHRGKSLEARQHLEEAVRLLPKSVAAWGMLAAAYAEDGHWERYDKAIREMERLTPSTPEDFLFKGYAEAYLEPERGLQTIKQGFDRRPMWSIALLLRAEVRAFVAQDKIDLAEAEWAVQDAKYAKELLRNNPAALWVSLETHLAKAGVHEYHGELKQRWAELELAGEDADALKPHTALPEAVVYRWTYFREVGREEEVLDELRRASKDTGHVSANFCCALALYRRGKPGDFEEALRVLENRPGTYNDRLLPFVLAEHDYPNKHNWPARARKASEDFAATAQDGLAVMNAQTVVLCLLGKKGAAVEASKALLKRQDLFYTLRREPILRSVCYNAGELSADELLGRAGRSRWDQCLAHYYIAMMKLAEGDRNGAKEHFDKAVKTRAWGWGEYDLSWVFLSRLEKDPTWPPWIPERP